jgi:hypothetical protein
MERKKEITIRRLMERFKLSFSPVEIFSLDQKKIIF